MRILALGDIVGSDTVPYLQKHLSALQRQEKIDFTVANGENVSEIRGILPKDAIGILDSGVDLITLGNHAFGYKEIYSFLDANEQKIIRPANFPPSAPGNGYTVVSVANLTAFRLRMRKGKQFIAIPTTFEDIVPEDMKIEKLSSDQKYFRLSIDANTPIDTYTDLLGKITKATLDRYPTEWGCCSRYEACSDAGSCIHPDKEFALKCAYRKNLNAGRIFYGKNRTK